jgi:hypothetical protein
MFEPPASTSATAISVLKILSQIFEKELVDVAVRFP